MAILEGLKDLTMKTISQIDIFKEFGGTIPEISSRLHVKNINLIQKLLLNEFDLNSIDYITYTEKPGLVAHCKLDICRFSTFL